MAKMATKTFKCPKWMAAVINKAAEDQEVFDGEWIRRAIEKELKAQGYSADMYDFFTEQLKDSDTNR
jgi:hypothetical protein